MSRITNKETTLAWMPGELSGIWLPGLAKPRSWSGFLVDVSVAVFRKQGSAVGLACLQSSVFVAKPSLGERSQGKTGHRTSRDADPSWTTSTRGSTAAPDPQIL